MSYPGTGTGPGPLPGRPARLWLWGWLPSTPGMGKSFWFPGPFGPRHGARPFNRIPAEPGAAARTPRRGADANSHLSEAPPGGHDRLGPGLGTGVAEGGEATGLGTSFPHAPDSPCTPALSYSREPSIPPPPPRPAPPDTSNTETKRNRLREGKDITGRPGITVYCL